MIPEDIAHINKRAVTDETELPEDIRYATASYFNRDQDSINAALFEERCKVTYSNSGFLYGTVADY